MVARKSNGDAMMKFICELIIMSISGTVMYGFSVLLREENMRRCVTRCLRLRRLLCLCRLI